MKKDNIRQIADISEELNKARERKDALSPTNLKKKVLAGYSKEKAQIISEYDSDVKRLTKSVKAELNSAKEDMEAACDKLLPLLNDAFADETMSHQLGTQQHPFDWMRCPGKKTPLFVTETKAIISDPVRFLDFVTEHDAWDLLSVNEEQLANYLKNKTVLPDGIEVNTESAIKV